VGIHIEWMLFARFPERWKVMNLVTGEWGAEILRNNVFWTHEGFGRADVLCGAWRQAPTHLYGRGVGFRGRIPCPYLRGLQENVL